MFLSGQIMVTYCEQYQADPYSEVAVNILAVANSYDANNERCCLRRVNYSIITYSDAVVVLLASDLLEP